MHSNKPEAEISSPHFSLYVYYIFVLFQIHSRGAHTFLQWGANSQVNEGGHANNIQEEGVIRRKLNDRDKYSKTTITAYCSCLSALKRILFFVEIINQISIPSKNSFRGGGLERLQRGANSTLTPSSVCTSGSAGTFYTYLN